MRSTRPDGDSTRARTVAPPSGAPLESMTFAFRAMALRTRGRSGAKNRRMDSPTFIERWYAIQRMTWPQKR